MDGPSTVRKFEFDKIYIGITANNYYSRIKASYYTEGDSIFVTSEQGGYGIGLPFQVKPNTAYTILNPTKKVMAIGEYDEEGKWLQWQLCSKGLSFITSAKTKILLIVLRPEEEEAVEYKDIQFYEGHIVNIYLNEPLRKVGNYADYIDFKTGKVVRPVKEKIFTGEEGKRSTIVDGKGWTAWESETSKSIGVWYCDIFGELGENKKAHFVYARGICSHFIHDNLAQLNTRTDDYIGNCRFDAGANPPYFGFRVAYTTLDEWLEFLKSEYNTSHPLTVDYVLVTPTEETISLPELPAFEDYSKIEILTQIAPSKITAEYEGYTIE